VSMSSPLACIHRHARTSRLRGVSEASPSKWPRWLQPSWS